MRVDLVVSAFGAERRVVDFFVDVPLPLDVRAGVRRGGLALGTVSPPVWDPSGCAGSQTTTMIDSARTARARPGRRL
jgi:hypothetical protein